MSAYLTNSITEYNEENDNNDDDEDDTISNNARQDFKVSKIDIHNGNDTQIGNQNIYHGTVDVHNFVQISGPSSLTSGPSGNNGTPVNLPNISFPGCSHTPPDIQPTIHVYPASPPPQSVYLEYGATSSNRYLYSGAINTEREPLLKPGEKAKNRMAYKLLILAVFSLIIVSSVLTFIYGHQSHSSHKGILPANFTHIFRSRQQWGALPPKVQINRLKYDPAIFVVVGHTDSSPCNNSNACSIKVRNIQAQQLASHFDDIAYSFLVAGDGLIYEGRGWDEATEATRGMGCSSLAVAFVGNFTVILPPQKQIDAFKLLLDSGESTGRLDPNYQMFMQNQIGHTISPGPKLTDLLEKWDHSRPFSQSEDLVCGRK